MINQNKYNFIPGDKVRLDAEFSNTSVVVIVSMTPNKLYSRVIPSELENPTDSDAWDTMTNRLTPLENGK
jgi:hypothetical protein